MQFRQPNINWINQCIMSDSRRPIPLPNLANALIGLENDPGLLNALAFNAFSLNVTLLHEIGDPSRAIQREAGDNDIATIQDYLQHAGLKQLGKDTVHQAVALYAVNNTFHPVREFFDRIEWDHTPRADLWLPTYAGTATTDYEMHIGQMFLIAMVARILKPGCKADYMMVLEGPQGKLKSTLFGTLADPWYSDDLPEITGGGKDAKVHLRGKWLIEVAELHAFNRADALLLKSFLSRKVEEYRPPFGRIETKEPRQCVFAGTTNRDAYLRDETGGRRFWGVKAINKIDIAGMERDRDQLIAEAIVLYKSGSRWWPAPEFEERVIKPQQDERYEDDEWTEKILAYLDGNGLTETSVAVIAERALGFADKTDRLGTREGNRIRGVLSRNGWQIGSRGHGGVRKWVRTGKLI